MSDPDGKEAVGALVALLWKLAGYVAGTLVVTALCYIVAAPAGQDVIGGLGRAVGKTYDCITEGIAQIKRGLRNAAKSFADDYAQAKDVTARSTPTYIYRYGGTNPGNLTPKAKDRYTGLSFSTIPQPGAAVTTIEALNATGVVYAVQDDPTHVSVRPIGGTMDDWINAGSGSIWTQAVKSAVVKWDGAR